MMRVVQVSFYADARRRDAESLLAAWTTLPAVASAVARQGVHVDVVQAAHVDETLRRDAVTFHFVDDDRAAPKRLLGRVPIPRRPSRLLDLITQLAPDVVHVHGFV